MLKKCDFLVIGSGLAGLSFALKLADHGRVMVISKTEAPFTNTAMAQGGIAAVMSPDDSFENHVRDTLIAGAGLCRKDIVERVIQSAPDRIDDLINWGVRFDVEEGEAQKVNLAREGGHSHRRILHVQDHTGADIHAELLKRAVAHKNIEIFEGHFAIDLILNRNFEPTSVESPRCHGAYVFNKSKKQIVEFYSRFTMLATGGAGKTYLYTTNWSGATGDGIAMAYRAGARVANLEFMQFHPTCLYHPGERNFLITEALRGEGAELINDKGEAFAKKFHPQGSLAPRDIVARSIDAEMKRSGAECVYLNISHRPAEFIRDRFPQIYKRCMELGIDITKQPIPVVPAAHYLCGGILTDWNACTDIKGLLASGENACTGLHGANRLASNSLLECLVFSHNAAEYCLKNLNLFSISDVKEQGYKNFAYQNEDEMIVITHMWDEIRRLMWNYVGIVRSNRRLLRAKTRLDNILSEVQEFYGKAKLHPDILELRNIALVAHLSVQCALKRQESRGIHYNLDYPNTNETPLETIINVGSV